MDQSFLGVIAMLAVFVSGVGAWLYHQGRKIDHDREQLNRKS